MGVTSGIDGRKRKEHEIARINGRPAQQDALLHELNEALQRPASADPPTGIANRRTLMALDEKECGRAQRFDHPLSILTTGIDSSERIDDRCRHRMGDRAVRATADICRMRGRSGADLVARLGAEEFAVLLPETDEASAAGTAEKLRAPITGSPLASEEGDAVAFTASIGVASRDADLSMDALIHRADKALHQAERQGRDRVRRFERARTCPKRRLRARDAEPAVRRRRTPVRARPDSPAGSRARSRPDPAAAGGRVQKKRHGNSCRLQIRKKIGAQ